VPAPLAKKEKKKNSTDFPSMAVCCATLFHPKKGKGTWGVEISPELLMEKHSFLTLLL
jgi:hypothetical protein